MGLPYIRSGTSATFFTYAPGRGPFANLEPTPKNGCANEMHMGG